MKIRILITVAILSVGCVNKEQTEPSSTYEMKIVTAKSALNHPYEVGYSDATSFPVDFGLYSLVNVGDTICHEKTKHAFYSITKACLCPDEMLDAVRKE